MKKITFFISLLLTYTFCIGQNLLTNGDLEPPLATGKITSATSPWSSTIASSNLQSSINNNSSVAHGGEQFVNLPNDFTSFKQPFTAVIGKEYTVKFWCQFISGQGQPAGTDGIYVSIRQDTGDNGTQYDPVVGTYVDPSAVDANWNEFSFTFTATHTNLLFYVGKQARQTGNPNNAARMDDFSITENSTASVADLTAFNFKAYPNPANKELKITASEPINSIQIVSILGKTVLHKKVKSNNISLNIEDLSTGVYIVRTQINNKIGSYKLIKN